MADEKFEAKPAIREKFLLDKLRSPEEHLVLVVPINKNVQMVNMLLAIHDNLYGIETLKVDERGARWLRDE